MTEPKKDQNLTSRKGLRASSAFMVAAMGLFLWLPLLGQSFGPEVKISEMEQRLLAPKPSPTWEWRTWLEVPNQTDRWFNDHLGFRSTAIHHFARGMIGLFKKSPSDQLILGQEGWLFFGDRNAVDHYQGVAPLSSAELSEWQHVLEERREALAERDIPFLLVLVPDKHLIYAEHMPENLPRASEVHPLDQLVQHMAKHSDVEILDLRDPLEAAKEDRRIYQKTDSHWNDEGAYSAYQAILERAGKLLPQLEEHSPAAVRRDVKTEPGLGLARIVGMAYEFPEENFIVEPLSPRARIARHHRARYHQRVERLQPIAHGVEGSEYPRAVMFRDSFGNELIPYLSEHFERILFVWERDVDLSIVDIEKPDIVIQEIVGRFLSRRPRTTEEASADRRKRR